MIDVHSHIIPGVDDGASNIDESVEIAVTAEKAGVKTLFATPHALDLADSTSWDHVNQGFDDLKKRVARENIDIEIVRGAEIFITPDLPKRIKENKKLTINGQGRYILLELPLLEIPDFTEQVIFDLIVCGVIPIIAHPERYVKIWEEPNRLFDFIKRGALTHVNSGSLTGRYGKNAQKTAKLLISHNLIHMMGSDIHSSSTGAYTFAEGFRIIKEISGPDRALEMVTSIPANIIKGDPVRVPAPKPVQQSFLKRLFKWA